MKRITANAVLCAVLCLQANASLLREISLPGAEVVAMAFSPSGDSLAVVFDQGNQMGALAVFPLGGRKAESRWDGIPQPGEGAVHMGEVRWSSDGHGLASRSGHELRFADLQTGKSCHVSLAPGSDPYLGGIMEASRIAVISYRQQGVADSHQVSFYDSNCQLVGAAPFADALAAAGQREMIACSTAGIRWLDTAGRFVRELKLPPEACQSIALAGNGGIFCVSTNRRAVVCRDAQSGAEAGLWPGTFRGELVAVSSGARRVALRSHKEIQLPFTDATIQPSWTWLVWDFSNGKQVGSVNKTGDLIPRPVHRSPPRAALSSDGKVMALGEDAKIKLYQIE